MSSLCKQNHLCNFKIKQ
jgi:hypothetical protein